MISVSGRPFPFVWYGSSSRVPDGSSSHGTSPTRSLRWKRRRSRTPLLLLDHHVSLPGPEVIPLSEGYGTASVIATFSVPGEYLMLAQVDNWAAPDSGSGDQCCWTNGYVRVSVR